MKDCKVYPVLMLAFGKDNEVRLVEVPEKEVDKNPDELLNMIFHYGQNDFQPKNHPSVSVGDVILLNGDIWRVAGVGFKRMNMEELDEYIDIDRQKRHYVK